MAHGMPFKYASFQGTFYQCSACAYTSALKHHVVNHVKTVCRDADVLDHKCACVLVPVGQTVDAARAVMTLGNNNNNNILGNNTINQTIHNNNNTFNLVHVGSEEEKRSLEALLLDPSTRHELANLPPHAVPGALLRLWKGADAPPELKNIHVRGNKVDEVRGPDNVVSVARSKFVKKTVNDMLVAVDRHAPDAVPEIRSKDFAVSKRRKVSPLDAAGMQATGCRTAYALDANGRQFLASANASVDSELDAL